jgi:hypothetical protein
MTARPHDQPLNRLLQSALSNVESIIRSEFRLAKTEVSRDARQAGIGGGLLLAGAVLGIYAFGLFLDAIVEMLEEVIPEWLAELLVATTLAATGTALAMAGLERVRMSDVMPRETIDSLREDVRVGGS